MGEAKVIGLLGAGGHAREVRSYLPAGAVVFWAVSGSMLNDGPDDRVDIAHPDPRQQAAPVIGAVGAPGLRRELVAQWPGASYCTVVAPSAYVGETCVLGAGTVIAPGAVLTDHVTAGEHCLVNAGATVSHDVTLGDYATVSPGAHIAGNVSVGEGAFLGIGAVVSHRVTLAPGVVVAAGAVVMSDVTEPNAVVAGVPAQVVRVREGWLREL